MSIEIKKKIESCLQAFLTDNLTQNALNLFNTLGYNTDRQASLDKPYFPAFKAAYAQGSAKFNEEKALVKDWKYVDLLFQLSKDEVTRQNSLFDTKRVDNKDIQSYLFFTIELSGNTYSRTVLAQITREVNKLFPMPAMVLFKTGNNLTFSIINRRLHKKDENKDVLEKVTLIKDISIENPHRAHIEILFDLSFDELLTQYNFTNFVELHDAWQKTLDTKELNKRFYQELSNWYFWAKELVQFPVDVEKDDDKRNSTSLIRLITRIVFIWFVKEKNLVPDELFDPLRLSVILKEFNRNKKSSSYYSAVLQNLFFGTLNQKMDERGFAKNGTFEDNRTEYGVKNMLRHAELFSISEKEVIALFQSIPFLNGGLFDCLDKPDDSGKILYSDGFSRNPKKQAIVPDFLFFGNEQECDLNEIFGTRNKHYKVKGLIEILSSYKFTIAENTPLEEEVALDPELLGKVFENLLASYNPETQTTARKQTGSFYTPREIVDYMVNESLLSYFKNALLNKTLVHSAIGAPQTIMFDNSVLPGQLSLTENLSGVQWNVREKELEIKLRQLLSYMDETHAFSSYDVDLLINAIDTCKIIDPACGSGAFPMGILHKLVFILHKLDPKNEKWREQQRQKAIKETEETYKLGDKKERERLLIEINDVFDNNSDEYGRKLYLIENCIYGVDIQPIAVQIAKLRFFISLIIDQNKRPEKENLGVRSLPNLETKFVAADTLIALERHYDEKGGETLFRNADAITQLEEELRKIRHNYFSAKTRKEKLKYQKQDKEKREAIANELVVMRFSEDDIVKLKNYDPYDQSHGAAFFDSEWMFGLRQQNKTTGVFDIVIGNPPYVQIQNFSGMQQQKDWERQKFETYAKTGDVYCLFYERGLRLLKNGGVLTYITSNKWMRANYGKVIRKYFAEKTNPVKIVDFENYSVFDATVNTNIIMIAKAKNSNNLHAVSIKEDFKETTDLADYLNINGVILKSLGEDSWLISSNEEYAVKKRIEQVGVPLKDWDISIYRGILTGLNEAFIIDGKKKDELIAKDLKNVEIIKPILLGKDIKRFRIEFEDLWLIFIPWHFPLHEDTAISGNSSKAEKAFQKTYPAIYNHLLEYKDALSNRNKEETGIRYEWYALQRCAASYYHEFEKDMITWGNLALSAQFAIAKANTFINAPSPLITPANKYLLAVLNSKIGDYYIRSLGVTRSGGYFEYKPMFVENLPVPQITAAAQLPFEILVDCILFCKSRPQNDMDSQCALLESIIDGLVYDLYFPDEMKASHCYITDRISNDLKSFKKSNTVAAKTEYVKTLEKLINKDEIISHSMTHRNFVKPVQVILGDKK